MTKKGIFQAKLTRFLSFESE